MRYGRFAGILLGWLVYALGYSFRGNPSIGRSLNHVTKCRSRKNGISKRTLTMDAFGYCARCQQVHIIPTTSKALKAAAALVHVLETTGRLDFDASSQWNPDNSSNHNKKDFGNHEVCLREYDARLSVRSLVEERGKMLGVLVCSDPRAATTSLDHKGSGSGASTNFVVLKAFSGKVNGYWNVPGWAPSLYGTALYGGAPEDIPRFAALQKDVADAMALEAPLIEQQIEGEGADGEDASKFRGSAVAAKLQRQSLSREALAVLREYQIVANFRGEARTLAQVHLAGEAKVPVGTGDCCATKLIAEAQVRGLVPLGIAEFYFGKRARAKTRVEEGTWYDACAPRCQQVLGFMLCGLEQEKNVKT